MYIFTSMIYDTYYGRCGFADEIIKMSKNPANKDKKFRTFVSFFLSVLLYCFHSLSLVISSHSKKAYAS